MFECVNNLGSVVHDIDIQCVFQWS